MNTASSDPAASGTGRTRIARVAVLVFVALTCLYALTAGGQGYSVDGTFSFRVAESVATDPTLDFVRRNAGTLRRWGPVAPALGVPFAWIGHQIGRLVPPAQSVRLDGQLVRLHEWAPLGKDAASEFRGPLEQPVMNVSGIRLVSFLSLSTEVPNGATVGEVELLNQLGAVVQVLRIRAGHETAEWAYDAQTAPRPAHAKGRVAGFWQGNPNALLYRGDLILPELAPSRGAPGAAASATGDTRIMSVVVRATGGVGRLHVRSLELLTEAGYVGVPGPDAPVSMSSVANGDAQFFTRFAHSFLNVPLVGLLCALLVPLGRQLGYALAPATVMALVAGTGTLLWPYAKHDFSEPVAAVFLVLAVVVMLAALKRERVWRHLMLASAGTLLALAMGARYTTAAVVPLYALQVIATSWRSVLGGGTASLVRRALLDLASLSAVPLFGLLVIVLITGRVPAIWSGVQSGLALRWLDYPLWAGVTSLLVSSGKGLLWYAPPLVLALIAGPAFVRRHGAQSIVFVGIPALYLLMYGSKGVWHGGGWGPRYLLPAVPFLACVTLPAVQWLMATITRQRLGIGLAGAGIAIQILGVAKHPNLYSVLFRDHILAGLPDYGQVLGGPLAGVHYRHFDGPGAGRQLERPPTGVDPSWPLRGLGYAYAESGNLILGLRTTTSQPFDLTLYVCDWDQRGRRQRVSVTSELGTQGVRLDEDFSACSYVSWSIAGASSEDPLLQTVGRVLSIEVEPLVPVDVPVVSAVFFDPVGTHGAERRGAQVEAPLAKVGDWVDQYGKDGYALFGWNRGADVTSLPAYVTAIDGGDRVWIDTWEAELGEIAPLYAPGFSPLLAHAWLLGADAVTILRPEDAALQQRLLGSPPWRYAHGLELHAPHPEFGLGVDFWQLLVRARYRSHADVMAWVWGVTALLALNLVGALVGLRRAFHV